MKLSRLVLFLLLCVAVTGTATARDMILQAQPNVSAAAQSPCDVFTVCSLWHELYPEYCTIWHVVYCGPIDASDAEMGAYNQVEKAFLGRELGLENQSGSLNVKINRVVPQYHLASGVVVEPDGKWNARNATGEKWSQVGTEYKQIYGVARWTDSNKDGMVGVGDKVVFTDGTKSKIKSVRLGVHVTSIE